MTLVPPTLQFIEEASARYVPDMSGAEEALAGTFKANSIEIASGPTIATADLREADLRAWPVLTKESLELSGVYLGARAGRCHQKLEWREQPSTPATAESPTTVVTVDTVIDSLSFFHSDVAARLREIRTALREDFGCDLHLRSLTTLDQVLQQVPRVPQPRLGAGEDGTLDAVWALSEAGIFTAELLPDGKIGCAAVLDTAEPSYSETLEAPQACALLNCFARLRLLKRR